MSVRNSACGLALLAAFVIAGRAAHAAPPERIVSLNLCVDQILIDLVPRARIAAVTHLAADASVSAAPATLAGLPVTRGAAEDVLARNPDLVIAGAYTTPATVDLLKRLGRRVIIVPLPDTIAGVRALIADIAVAVEEPAAGAKMIGDLDARLARVRTAIAADPARPTALLYQINNYVAGAGTLADEAIRLAGLTNHGATLHAFTNGKTDLEQIIAAPPDLMVLATKPDAFTTVVGDNLRHPALARLAARSPTTVLPWPLWLCGTQHIATAVEQLAVARTQLRNTQPLTSKSTEP